MMIWSYGDIYPVEYMDFLFKRVIGQIRNTCQDIIYVFDFFNSIGDSNSDPLVINAFNEIIRMTYEEWSILRTSIIQLLKDGKIDNANQIIIKTNLHIIMNHSYAWESLTRAEAEPDAEKIGKKATQFYDSVVNTYKKIQSISSQIREL